MPKRTLIVIATPLENPFYGNALPSSVDILLTGVGKINATLNLTRYLAGCSQEIERIVNFGICGTVNEHTPLFSTFHISRVIEGDRPHYETGAHAALELVKDERNLFQSATLVSQDIPIHSDPQRHHVLQLGGNLVDMEGFAFATVSQAFHLPIDCIKVVSDFADDKTSASIQSNLDNLRKQLQQAAKTYLELP